MSHPGGRPTKYCQEILDKANEYIETWEELGDSIPMICSLAIHCGIDKTTVYEWEKDEDKKEFSHVCARVRACQEKVLINKGLTRESEASLSKLLLRKHGYTEGVDLDLSSKDGSMKPNVIEIVAPKDV